MGTKTNPGAFNCYAAALPDEEIFTVLGRDPATPATIRFWIGERARLGKNVTTDDIDRLGQAAQVADNAEAWRAEMLDPMGDGVPAWKLPRPRDLDDGPRICIDPNAPASISEETARWIQNNLRAAHQLMRTSTEAGDMRSNFAAHDASQALTEIAIVLCVPAEDAPRLEPLPEATGYFGDGDEAVRVSRAWLRGLSMGLKQAASNEEGAASRSEAACLDTAELLDLAAHSRTLKVEDRMSEPLRTAQIAAERLQAEVRYLELHRLSRALIDITGDCIYEAPQHAAWTSLRMFLIHNLPREIIDAKTGGGVIVEARGDMTSHYRAWRSAMEKLARQAPIHLPDEADLTYWLHEIRKLDHCFTALGYILPEDVPDMPVAEEDRGGCDCAAGLAGNSPPHHPTCPMYVRPVEMRAALSAPYGKAGQEKTLVDTAPGDLAHAPEVAPHRFSQFIKGEQYAYARGLEVSPQHLPVALDAMARDGWHLLAIFGSTDSKNIGFIFERGIPLGQERYSAFELAHGLGGGFDHLRPRVEPESDRMSAYHSGRPLDEIDGGGKDLTGACGLGRQQEP